MRRPKHRSVPTRHRGAPKRPVSTPGVLAGALTLTVAGALVPAYGDTHSPFHHEPQQEQNNHSDQNLGFSNSQGPRDSKDPKDPKDPKEPAASADPADPALDDADQQGNGAPATNGGSQLAQDAGLLFGQLKGTAMPLTPFEMPFPCGEEWIGSTRNGHSPSIRSIDFNRADDLGDPVVAAAAGTVVTAVTGRNRPSYGQYVVIDHGNNETSLYGHLDSVLVTVGQVVAQGEQIGTLGGTGNATGPHLHFEERFSSSVVDAWFHGALFPMNSSATSANCGVPADVPLAGNMYGTPAAEVMVYRRSTPGAFHVARTVGDEIVTTMGTSTDQPMLGDWDGNGRVNPAVRTPSTRVFHLRVRKRTTDVKFGKASDVAVAGNWDGAGAWEIGVRRPTRGKFLLRAADGTVTKVALGDADDVPVTGDWNGDGRTDLGVYDGATATFTLLTVDAAGTSQTTQVVFGTPGTAGVVPVVGDWDGNGTTDLGTWNPVSQSFYHRAAASPTSKRAQVVRVAPRITR